MARTTPVHGGYTIIAGVGTGSNGGRIDVWAEYKLGAQSVAGNYTPIEVYFYAALNPSYSSSTSYYQGLNASLKVDGVAGDGVSNGAYDFTSSNKVNWLGSYSGNIAHNADGTKTISISGSFTTASSYISGGSVSASLTLPTIPRASSVSASDADIGSTAPVFIGRKSTGFTHTIAFEFGALSGYIDADGNPTDSQVQLSETTMGFNLPASFYEQIPNDPFGICTLSCQTYSGSTAIGEPQLCTFKARAEETTCRPVVSGVIEDCNPATLSATGDKNVFVRGISNARCTFTNVAVKNNASLVGKAVGGASVDLTEDEHIIMGIEVDSVEFTATDSRGYTGRHTEPINSMIPYVPLTCNASVKRPSPTSDEVVLTVSGQCWYGNFGLWKNYFSIEYSVGEQYQLIEDIAVDEDNSYSYTLTIPNLDYTKAYQLKLEVNDAFSLFSTTLNVNKGIPVFDWGESDFRFNVPVSFSDNKAGLAAYPVGSIYMSINDTSPADIFGGKWERIQDRFLLAAGATYKGGSTGGEESHKLKSSELPSHSHNVNALVYGYDGWTERTTDTYTVAHVYGGDEYLGKGVTKKMADVFGGGTYSIGDDQPHNNMPPYLAVYMWKRTE